MLAPMHLIRAILPILGGLVFLVPTSARTQAPGVPVQEDETYRKTVTAAAETLLKQGKLLPLDSFQPGLAKTQARPLAPLPPATSTPLSPAQVCEKARRAMLSIGTLYRCGKCELWHTNLAGGYAIQTGGVAVTSLHVLKNGEHPESYLIAADAQGRVFPVLEILGVHLSADAVILQTGASDLDPLPLQTSAHPGDPVFCLSSPGGVRELFTTGIVSRFFAKSGSVFLHVTADWASGSSGSPVLDRFGNVLGHVASTRPLKASGTPETRYIQTVLKEATAAAEIVKLLAPH
jgi:serine protease Do